MDVKEKTQLDINAEPVPTWFSRQFYGIELTSRNFYFMILHVVKVQTIPIVSVLILHTFMIALLLYTVLTRR